MVAVPEELAPAVMRFVEGLEDERAQGTGGEGEEGFVHGWSAETVRRAYRESADRMREILDFLAQNPGREVSSSEIADAIEARYGWNTVAGMLGAFGRRCANRYGRSEPMWEVRYDDRDRTLVRMPRAAAEAILGLPSRI